MTPPEAPSIGVKSPGLSMVWKTEPVKPVKKKIANIQRCPSSSAASAAKIHRNSML